jgi:ADP-heptose:LPS heptosyltransferase
LPPAGCGLHAVDFYRRQSGSLAACLGDAIPRIRCPLVDAGFAAIHPFAGSPQKRWPFERFQELASRLSRRLPVAWCAGPQDDLAGAVRFNDLYDFACWLASARVYIGNDSGPTHLAAAVGTPVVAIFGPSNPTVWAQRGPRVAVAAAGSVARITAETIENLVLDVTGRSPMGDSIQFFA